MSSSSHPLPAAAELVVEREHVEGLLAGGRVVAVEDRVEEVGAAVDEVPLGGELDAEAGGELVGRRLRQVLDPAALDLAYGERPVGVDQRIAVAALPRGRPRRAAAARPR